MEGRIRSIKPSSVAAGIPMVDEAKGYFGKRIQFQHGVQVGAIAGGLLLGLLFTLAAPTNDYRARFAWLLGGGGLASVGWIGGAFLLVGTVFLLLCRSPTWASFRGLLMGTGGSVFLTYSLVYSRVVPEFHSSSSRAIAASLTTSAALGMLLLARATATKRGRSGLEGD